MTVTPPNCSVIVPTFRRPGQLAQCLDALGGLEYPRERLQVIVVDDAGGVPLESVIDAHRDRLDLTLLERAARGGPAAARNTGTARAEGEVLAFTDDDCVPASSWLAHLAQRVAADPDCAAGGRIMNALPGSAYSTASQLIVDVGYAYFNSAASARFLSTNNLALPAHGFRSLGGFDERFTTAEDRELCDRWHAQGMRMRYEPDAVVYHARHLTLASFCRQHFGYGRGAFRFHRKQRRQGRSTQVELSYYADVLRYPLRRGIRNGVRIWPLLVLWQLCNTAGFAWESVSSRSSRGQASPRSPTGPARPSAASPEKRA